MGLLSGAFKAVTIASGVVGAALVLAGKSALGAAANYEQSEIAFGTMLGSADKARRLMKDLADFGKKTPFELPELIESSKKLVAFGTAQEKLIPTLRRLGDIAAGVGVPVNELAELYGKAQVQGRLFAEDVNQLTGRGIPIIQEFARQFKVADSEVKELVESGQIGFPQLEKAFENLTKEGGKFGGLMEAQSASLSGMVSNFKDGIGEMMRQIGQRLLPYAKKAVEELNGIIAAIPGAIDRTIQAVKTKIAEGKQAWADLKQAVADFIDRAMQIPQVAEAVEIVRRSFQDLKAVYATELKPALDELWATVKNDLLPVLKEWWPALQLVIGVMAKLALESIPLVVGSLTGFVTQAAHVLAVITQLVNALTGGLSMALGWLDSKLDSTIKWLKIFADGIDRALEKTKAFSRLGDMAKNSIPGQFIGGAPAVIGSLFGRAGGGLAQQGKPVVVGENGPELFIPDSYGAVSNRGGAQINLYVTGNSFMGREGVADQIAGEIMRQLKRNALV